MPVTETYGSTKPQPSDTRRVLLGKILNATLAGGGGGGGAQGNLTYTGTDPNSDGIVPPNPAIGGWLAVKPGSAIYVWSVANQDWE